MVCVHYFGWIPIYTTPPKTLWDELLLLSIPAAAVGFRSSALMMRLTRSSMLEVLRQDYIRTARAKGASYAKVNFVHALRNAVLPIVTIVGIEAAFLVGGLIVTETVFNIPGVARFLVEAIRSRDYPIVQNLVMFIAVMRRVDQFPDRHGLPRARSAHRVREINGCDRNHRDPAPRKLARGTLGFYVRALSARRGRRRDRRDVRADGDLRALDHAVRSDAHQLARLARRARRRASARRRLHGPRHVEPHRLRRAHLARGRRRLDRARLPVRRHHRADLGIFRRLVRPDRAALHGHDAVAAAAGDGAGDDRGARALARRTPSSRSRSRWCRRSRA